MRQAFACLLDNAARLTSEGVVTFSAAATPRGELRIVVRDTGPGIPAGELERIFEKFYRLSGNGNQNGAPQQGIGLGLTICRHIVTHYGGRIRVESEPGQGSTFTIELPKTIFA
jgi:signal transduction histidine kinase